MENILSIGFTGNALLLLLGLLFIFHWLVLFGMIPYDIVWAGKIKNRKQLVKMESISILVLILTGMIVCLKMEYLNFSLRPTGGMWFTFVLFTLNTIGNLTAKNPIEKYGFGLLTIVIALLSFRLAIAP